LFGPAAVVVLLYGIWLLSALRHGDPQDFIHIGRTFVAQGGAASAVISERAAGFRYGGQGGYDGQFFYFIAVDPTRAGPYLDGAAFRYSRIVYPLLARALALGGADAVPVALIAVNVLAIAVSMLLLAAWLRRRQLSPWLACVYGFYPGVFLTLQRDLADVTAYTFVIAAVYLLESAGWARAVGAGVCFGLAGLTRETTLVFAVLYAGTSLVRNGWRNGAALFALSVGPYLVWKGFLFVSLHSLGTGGGTPEWPFAGILHYWPWQPDQAEEVRTVVVPAIIAGAAAVWAVWRFGARVELLFLLLAVVLYVVLLPAASYPEIGASSRLTIAVVLGALLALPYFRAGLRGWFWASSALWLSPMVLWLLGPSVAFLSNAIARRLPGF
jgi:hypothetical protein